MFLALAAEHDTEIMSHGELICSECMSQAGCQHPELHWIPIHIHTDGFVRLNHQKPYETNTDTSSLEWPLPVWLIPPFDSDSEAPQKQNIHVCAPI